MTSPNPLIANFLATRPDQVAANLPAPALGNNIAMPSAAPSIRMPALPAVSLISPPTRLQKDETERERLLSTGSGVDQVHNPLMRGIARAADITASVFAPRFAKFSPGTTLHHDYLVGQAMNNVAKDQAEEQATAQTANEAAATAHTNAATDAIINKPDKYTPIQTDSGFAAFDPSTGKAAPVLGPDGTQIGAPDKTKLPTNPFELWLKQNPNGTVDDFNKLQSKPLTPQEAASLNSVWDNLATKHHLPTGQFAAGMPHADATQLASALNSAIGKQQGDAHVSISLQGLQNQQTKNASLDTSDPAMQASVNAVANGSMKLADVFGRGATTAQKAQFAAAVKAVNPNYNSGDHDIENSARRYMISGQGGTTLNAINTAYHHLDTFDAAAQALKNGNTKALNEIANQMGIQVQNGASAPVVFNLVKTALTGELGKSFTGAGATVDEQKNLSTSLGSANNDATYAAVSGTARTLLRGKEQALQGQLSQGEKGQANFGAINPSGETYSRNAQGKLTLGGK